MKKASALFVFLGIFIGTFLSADPGGLQRLKEGNKRYVQDQLKHPDRTFSRRQALVSKQKPFAVIVGCADSRVAPEILFDQGIGDLFVVRVAGNVIGSTELDSILFATTALGSDTLLVLGHEGCGAVQAVLDDQDAAIPAVAKLIRPAINRQTKSLQSAVKANALRQKKQLAKNPTIKRLVADGKLTLNAGYYHLKSGEVELLD